MQHPELKPAFQHFILKNGRLSQSFGRRLYQCRQNGHSYWLKFQLGMSQPECEQGFLKELELYRLFLATSADFILPIQIVHLEQIPGFQCLAGEGLILPDGQRWPERDASELTTEQIRQVLISALLSVQALHQHGWVHGDLKPQHFICYQHRLGLIDFEQCQPIQQECSTASVNATPRYMAPELFHGEGKTQQTDLYALGIIFYEWLSGQRLQAKSYRDWALLHCQTLKTALPQQLDVFYPLIERLLARHKQRRFGQTQQALEALNCMGLL